MKTYQVKVIPNARQNQIVEQKDDCLKIKLTAPAVEGKANEALIKFLAEEFNVSKSTIEIIRGEKSRNKFIRFNN